MSGETAQKAMARSIARNPQTDGRTWVLRTFTTATAGSVLSQPTSDYTDVSIQPVVQSINEYEAERIGQNMRAGDLRLILPGHLTVDDTTVLICDGQSVDILRTVPSYQYGTVQSYKIYVRRQAEV